MKPGSVGRTSLLAAIALAAVLLQWFPRHGGAIKWALILLGLGYLIVGAVTTYPRIYRDRKRAAQLAADERDYRNYEHDLGVIRSKFAVDRPANGAPPPAYQAELDALNEKHRDMLTRKFGAY